MRKILILAANPKDTPPLRLSEELREIDEGLRRAKHRDEFDLAQRLAVRTRDIQRAMLDETPQIVHFSGHGHGDEGLVFENEVGQTQLVSGAALAGLFELFADPAEFPEPIQCVVLNGCYSEVQAKAIANHVPYVIGMSRAIGDRAAIDFAVGFYDALGAGRSVEFAFKLGCSAIHLDGIAEHLTPVLVKGKVSHPSIESTPSAQPVLQPDDSTYQTRLALFKLISELPVAQFEQLIFALQPPAGNIPADLAPQAERLAALFKWAESPIGCGLFNLKEVVERIAPTRSFQKTVQQTTTIAGTQVSGNKMVGKNQSINVKQDSAQVNNNWMEGEDQDINVD